MLMVAVRRLDVLFGATDLKTVPLPVPLASDVIFTQRASVLALHFAPDDVVPTLMLPFPPLTEKLDACGFKEHALSSPLCVTVNGTPPTVITPDLGAIEGFAPTQKPTAPFPSPLVPDVSVSQGALLCAIQEALEGETVNEMLLAMPDAGALTVFALRDTSGRGLPGVKTTPRVLLPSITSDRGFTDPTTEPVQLANPNPGSGDALNLADVPPRNAC